MSLAGLLIVIGLLLWLLTVYNTLGIILLVIGIVLLLAGPVAGPGYRRWPW